MKKLFVALILTGFTGLLAVGQTENTPKPIAPYSPYVWAGNTLYLAGQIPIDPTTGKVDAVTIEEQTRQVLMNIRSVLHAAGSGLDRVVKMTVFMTDLSDFQAMNAVYSQFFPADAPARSTVQVVALPLGVQIEMEAVALVE